MLIGHFKNTNLKLNQLFRVNQGRNQDFRSAEVMLRVLLCILTGAIITYEMISVPSNQAQILTEDKKEK